MLKKARLKMEKKQKKLDAEQVVDIRAYAQAEEQAKSIMMPVSRMSSSSLQMLIRNPLMWKMKYVFKIGGDIKSPTAVVGSAVHEALKFYYGGNEDIPLPHDINEAREMAIDLGLQYIDKYPDGGIKWGKTGTREGLLKTYNQTINFYFAEEPVFEEVLMSEKKLEGNMKTKDGDELPLVGVTIPDLVVRDSTCAQNEVDIVDFKTVTNFTDAESEDYSKIIQAKFLEHVTIAAKGWTIRNVIFMEIKTSKNADGSQQVKPYIIPCNHYAYDVFFYNLYRDVIKFISNPEAVYLPNFSDNFDGDEAGLVYLQGLTTGDMSDMEVIHKVKDVQFAPKKFIQSSLDSVENKDLLPEEKVKKKLAEFGIPIKPHDVIVGASFTQYRFTVSAGVRMASFAKHKADIAKALEAKKEVRILAPIPGTSFVGVEVENEVREFVNMKEEYLQKGTLHLPIGVDVTGKMVGFPLNDMPHLLIGGSTNSGKSYLLHSIIKALISQLNHEELRLTLIDPKRVELVAFKGIPHLVQDIIYEYEDGVRALLQAVDCMEERYTRLEALRCRNIAEYNQKVDPREKLPYIVIVFDEFGDYIMRSKIEEKDNKNKAYGSRSVDWLYKECKRRELLADLPDDMPKTERKQRYAEMLEEADSKDEMASAGANVELLIVRLTQMARAVGIHLIIATQSPRVDVITGLIKANMPTRIALTCSSSIESTIILGDVGAEKLNGKGDMLFSTPALGSPVRLQGFAN